MPLGASDWISIVNIVATSILSISVVVLSARSTKASVKTTELTEKSVELSERAIRLNEEINEAQAIEQRRYKNIIRFQYVDELSKKVKSISNIISTGNYFIIWKDLRDAELTQTIAITEMARYFSLEEVQTINRAWGSLEYTVESLGGVFSYSNEEQARRVSIIRQQLGIPISAVELLLEDIVRQGKEIP